MGLHGFELFIILLVAILLFGSVKISGLMGDLAKGLKTFRKTMCELDGEQPAASALPKPRRKRKIRSSNPTLDTR